MRERRDAFGTDLAHAREQQFRLTFEQPQHFDFEAAFAERHMGQMLHVDRRRRGDRRRGTIEGGAEDLAMVRHCGRR